VAAGRIHSFRDPFDLPAAHKLLGLGNNLSFIRRSSSGFMGNTRRIVLSTLGSLGDLHPVMALALGLQRAAEVVLRPSGVYRGKIGSRGARLQPAAPPCEPWTMRRCCTGC